MPFIFIRHAESVANTGGISKSDKDVCLSEKGFTDAQMDLNNTGRPLDLIVVSPYLRTKQTAEYTIKTYPQAFVAEWPVHEFSYLKCDGETTRDSRKQQREDYWNRNDPDYRDDTSYPGTESFNAFLDRVDKTIAILVKLPPQNVMVFTHGMFMRALYLRVVEKSRDMQLYKSLGHYVNLLTITTDGYLHWDFPKFSYPPEFL